jgi:hypothetical protein
VSAYIHILATIETDPTRYHGENPMRPRLLDSAGGEQVLAHLATDLTRMFPDIARCGLAMPGALYDQTQILRPGFPLHAALERRFDQTGGPSPAPRLVAGAEGGRMPETALQPDPAIPAGILQNLPLVVRAETALAESLAESMEHQFLEQGQLSAHSSQGLEANFGIAVTHARFMTLTDLLAMLRLQLEHFGFLPLWDLLDAALQGDAGTQHATGLAGQRFRFEDGAVHCEFETFDHWAEQGAGKDRAADGQGLEAGYVEWTREYRQYLTTLQAHAVPVVQHAPDGQVLKGGYLEEESFGSPQADAAEVTEHHCLDLGVLAVTVVRDGRQFNYYPLSPAGLNELHARIRSEGLGPAGFAYPGRMLHDPDLRRLVADSAAAND